MDQSKDKSATEGQASDSVKSQDPTLFSFFRSAPGPTKAKLVGLLTLAVAIAGTSSWIVVGLVRVQFSKGRPVRELASPSLPAGAVSEARAAYELNQLALGFSDRDRRRSSHAQFSLVLEMPTAESRDWMELHRAQLLDRVFEVGAEFTLEDFETPAGLEKLRTAFLDRFRRDFGKNAPDRVIFKDWVLQ